MVVCGVPELYMKLRRLVGIISVMYLLNPSPWCEVMTTKAVEAYTKQAYDKKSRLSILLLWHLDVGLDNFGHKI